jgi:hypothetical protein
MSILLIKFSSIQSISSQIPVIAHLCAANIICRALFRHSCSFCPNNYNISREIGFFKISNNLIRQYKSHFVVRNNGTIISMNSFSYINLLIPVLFYPLQLLFAVYTITFGKIGPAFSVSMSETNIDCLLVGLVYFSNLYVMLNVKQSPFYFKIDCRL